MTKTKVIRVFSFIMALTLVFAMTSSPAYADSRQFAAWVASALTAINITVNSTLAPLAQGLDDLNGFLNSPFKIENNQVIDVPLTYSSNDIENILNQSTLAISGDTVTIDGIDYTDIWLSHDAANKFRVNAFDFENAWDIASESEGTFVSGVGNFDGIPMFQDGNNIYSQNYLIPTSIDTGSNTRTFPLGNGYGLYQCRPNLDYSSAGYRPSNDLTIGLYAAGLPSNEPGFRFRYDGTDIYFLTTNHGTAYRSNKQPYVYRSLYDSTPFDFDWVAGNIPVEPLSESDGLHLLVPNNPEQWTDNPEAQQVINNINNYYQLNPDLSPGVDVDLDTPDIIDKLDDLLDIISNIIKLTKPSFGPHDSPAPPAPTGDLIPDTPWSYLDNHLKNIIQKLQNIIDGLTSIPTTIISTISNLRDTISNILNQIKNLLSDLVDNIVSGNANWFKDIVDSIWNPFQRIFAVFKAHIGIWHYVVDWLNNIRTPFAFFYGVLSGLGTLYTSPIFAAFAGVLVIAIYRRFGR